MAIVRTRGEREIRWRPSRSFPSLGCAATLRARRAARDRRAQRRAPAASACSPTATAPPGAATSRAPTASPSVLLRAVVPQLQGREAAARAPRARVFLVGEILPGGLQGVDRPRLRAARLLQFPPCTSTCPASAASRAPSSDRPDDGGEAAAAARALRRRRPAAPAARGGGRRGASRPSCGTPSSSARCAPRRARQRHHRIGGAAEAVALGARLRSIIEGDEQRLAELEELFTSLDADADGRLRLGGWRPR